MVTPVHTPSGHANYPLTIAIIGAATALLSLLLLVPWLGLDAPRGLWRLFHGMGSFGLLSLCTSGAALFWLGMRNLEHPRH